MTNAISLLSVLRSYIILLENILIWHQDDVHEMMSIVSDIRWSLRRHLVTSSMISKWSKFDVKMMRIYYLYSTMLWVCMYLYVYCSGIYIVLESLSNFYRWTIQAGEILLGRTAVFRALFAVYERVVPSAIIQRCQAGSFARNDIHPGRIITHYSLLALYELFFSQ